ncbi:hypothetical protein WN55_07031 [Dufourea novaeangliae]|uniref:Ig-like domain-containing protein n=1 Tax=Dufourea novaeangliae TaxID=178035 RepID=A0A154PT64_DUFNO|nr:hypothetical protein WN55_07031 [Dufourea novaeangliae]
MFVTEARARIIGTPDRYVKVGSHLTLTCLMSQGPHDLGTVAWYHGSQAVMTSPHSENDVSSGPRITVETEWSDALTSKLRITHAKLEDSGNYSCVPTVAEKASINVHVLNDPHAGGRAIEKLQDLIKQFTDPSPGSETESEETEVEKRDQLENAINQVHAFEIHNQDPNPENNNNEEEIPDRPMNDDQFQSAQRAMNAVQNEAFRFVT